MDREPAGQSVGAAEPGGAVVHEGRGCRFSERQRQVGEPGDLPDMVLRGAEPRDEPTVHHRPVEIRRGLFLDPVVEAMVPVLELTDEVDPEPALGHEKGSDLRRRRDRQRRCGHH